MNGQIFISYRREDTAGFAGRLYDRLHGHFPQNEIFMDIDSIDPGLDFVEAIEASVGSCDLLLAMIGKQWLNAADEEGRRRLDNPEDAVRLEIATALKRGIRVIPILVEGAVMPRSVDLPEDLKPLARRNALRVDNDRFRADAERLIGAVERTLESARVEQQHQEHDQRLTSEKEPLKAERRQKEAQDRLKTERQEHAASKAPPSSRTAPIEATVTPKKLWRLPLAIGSGIAILLLSLGLLFRPSRDNSDHADGRTSYRKAGDVGTPASSVPVPTAAPSDSPAVRTTQRGSLLIRESPLLIKPGISIRESLLATPTPASSNSPSPTLSGADWLVEAKRYLDARDYAQAFPLLQQAAEAGNAEAMNQLGELYRYGRGVSQDYGQARRWFQRAADAGNVWAMVNLGWLYENGRGVAQSPTQALHWYQKAVDAGASWASGDINRVR
jgi:TPR repeat protein